MGVFGYLLVRDMFLDRGTDYAWAVALVFGPVMAAIVLRWFENHDGPVLAHYLMRDFAFAAKDRGAYPEPLEARLQDFRVIACPSCPRARRMKSCSWGIPRAPISR